MKHISVLMTGLLLCGLLSTTFAQTYPYPELPSDTTEFGRYIQRSMALMQSSTPEKKNTVRVMVYGQSLSEQSWSDSINLYLMDKYPNANLVYKNMAVGGFSSQILWQTTKMDMLEFYPDLVIFHVFGHHKYYDTILQYTLQHTAAEMAIWTDPHEGSWADQMSYIYIPSYTEKYDLELMQIRDRWASYLDQHSLTKDDVTRDGTHLNDHGNFLLANLVKPYFEHKSKWTADPYGRVTTWEVGKHLHWNGDTLLLPFAGNRVDVITDPGYSGDGPTAEVWINSQRPSEIPELFNHTRPGKGPGEAWAWSNPVFLRHFNNTPWKEEHWTLTLDSLSSDYGYAEFHLEGSVTGEDGNGNSRDDFTSNSGRVVIHGGQAADDPYHGAWHIKRTHDVTGKDFAEGATIEWETYLMGTDIYTPVPSADPSIENSTTLAQGLPNGFHTLKIVGDGQGNVPIQKIRVYRPFLDREDPSASLSLTLDTIDAAPQGSEDFLFQINTTNRWFCGLSATWCHVADSAGTGYASNLVRITEENLTGQVRQTSLWIHAEGAYPVEIPVRQHPYSIEAAEDTVRVSHEDQTIEVNIESNGIWDASSGAGWITADVADRSGIAAVAISTDANESPDPRSGYVIVQINAHTRDTIIVVQEGKTVSMEAFRTGTDAIRIYPNPTRGIISIEPGDAQLRHIELFDLSGRSVHAVPSSQLPGSLPSAEATDQKPADVTDQPSPHGKNGTGSPFTFGLGHLPDGVYIIRVSTGSEMHNEMILLHH